MVDITTQIAVSLSVAIGGVALGHWARSAEWHRDPQATAQRLAIWLTTWPTTGIVLCSLWGMDLRQGQLWTLPLVGAIVSTASVVAALAVTGRMSFSKIQQGSFLVCAMFSNLGFLGGFLVFMFFGEPAYGVATLYMLYFRLYYITAGFGISARHGTTPDAQVMARPAEFHVVPMVGLVLGVLLGFSGWERPPVVGTINSMLIPATTLVHLYAIGITMRFHSVARYRHTYPWMLAIKFVWAPMVGLCCGWLLGYDQLLGGLVWRVVLIESMMPVALSSLGLAMIYRMDQDLANGLWLVTTLAILPLIPVLAWCTQHM